MHKQLSCTEAASARVIVGASVKRIQLGRQTESVSGIHMINVRNARMHAGFPSPTSRLSRLHQYQYENVIDTLLYINTCCWPIYN